MSRIKQWGSTLNQVMAWCLMSPSQYLIRCWPWFATFQIILDSYFPSKYVEIWHQVYTVYEYWLVEVGWEVLALCEMAGCCIYICWLLRMVECLLVHAGRNCHTWGTKAAQQCCIPKEVTIVFTWLYVYHIDGLVQERRNSSALALELHLSCTNPLIWNVQTIRSD